MSGRGTGLEALVSRYGQTDEVDRIRTVLRDGGDISAAGLWGASGALLLTTPAEDAPSIIGALAQSGIACAEIGRVEAGLPAALDAQTGHPLPRPDQDQIGRVYET